MNRQQARSPLEPLTTTIAFMGSLMGTVTVVLMVASLWIGSWSFPGWGDMGGCVDVSNGTLIWADATRVSPSPPAGSSIGVHVVSWCAAHPSTAQRLTAMLPHELPVLLFIGALLLVHRLLRRAQTVGIFTVATARGLRTLGWYLVLGSLVVSVLQVLAIGAFLHSVDPGKGWLSGANQFHLPLTQLLVGIGLLTFARVMRVGEVMREGLEGTV